MSEPSSEPTNEAPNDSSTSPQVEAPSESEQPEETGKGNAEAAKWRARLRTTETERDGLRGTLERLQRAEVHRLAADQLAQPDDVFDVAGVELADLIDDEGNVDPDLLNTAIHGIVTDRPGLARVAPRQKGPILTGHNPGDAGGSGTWQDVLRGG